MKRATFIRLTTDSHQHGHVLRDLLAKAALHRSAEQQIVEALPEQFRGKCRFVSYHDGDLTLSAPDGVVGSQLRMQQQDVLTRLRAMGETFQFAWRLKVKVIPAREPGKVTRAREPLSKENARLLKEEAGLTKDKGLREVLEKLAAHCKD
ncbi:MAG: DUF721 domain-containing protein [Marinobacter sp.]|nr:DUF721 domain-containing protein [Marinobacter sp.]